MGLDALFSDNSSEVQAKQTLRINEIEPNKSQPRTDFDEQSIANLADSIREHGLLQPILVRPLQNGGYQIVAGERRWRACRMLGMSEVPVLIRELSDRETAQIALIENLQRENLNPVEEAAGYKDLMEKYGMTQDDVARTVGKSRSSVANSLRILNMPAEIKEMLKKGEISAGHAKALASIENEELMLQTARRAAKGLATVREIEKLASKSDKIKNPKKDLSKERPDNFFKEMEIGLSEELRRKVRVSYSKNKGVVEIEFYSKEELIDIAERLTKGY